MKIFIPEGVALVPQRLYIPRIPFRGRVWGGGEENGVEEEMQ